MRTLDDLLEVGVAGRRVLVRCDLNVPLGSGEHGRREVSDDGRIRAALPVLEKLLDAGARVIVVTHLGRPKGAPDLEFGLAPVADRLARLLGRPVEAALDTVGESARLLADGLGDGEVLLLENVRFNPGETSKDDAERLAFARELAELFRPSPRSPWAGTFGVRVTPAGAGGATYADPVRPTAVDADGAPNWATDLVDPAAHAFTLGVTTAGPAGDVVATAGGRSVRPNVAASGSNLRRRLGGRPGRGRADRHARARLLERGAAAGQRDHVRRLDARRRITGYGGGTADQGSVSVGYGSATIAGTDVDGNPTSYTIYYAPRHAPCGSSSRPRATASPVVVTPGDRRAAGAARRRAGRRVAVGLGRGRRRGRPGSDDARGATSRSPPAGTVRVTAAGNDVLVVAGTPVGRRADRGHGRRAGRAGVARSTWPTTT